MNGYLLDTSFVIRLVYTPERIEGWLRDALAPKRQPMFVSVVSAFEMATKNKIGKLDLSAAFETNFEGAFVTMCQRLSANILPIRLAHAVGVRELPMIHRDPFDRLLIAQAVAEQLTFVTHDGIIPRYPDVTILRA